MSDGFAAGNSQSAIPAVCQRSHSRICSIADIHTNLRSFVEKLITQLDDKSQTISAALTAASATVNAMRSPPVRMRSPPVRVCRCLQGFQVLAFT